MENYRMKQRLGKGAQGSVYLVDNNVDHKQYVLKKVECNDESEANKAFKEAMALKELQHPYVCGYREFFVTWDKEESAMFVCIVMDYYKLGDLDKVLKQKRSKKEQIEELVIKKWLGQMIEALVFVHKNGVIHRDLKPSNIFMQEDLSISIGDFGVATIMGDARTKTRTTVGSMNWMAPEVLERPYDERSDVWSAGCITLELATCALFDTVDMAGKLFEIKHSPQALEDMLEEVGQKYSKDLVAVIRTMLRRNFKQRPTAQEMVDLPYIKECLALSGSALTEKKRKAQGPPPKAAMPKDKGIQPVLAWLKEGVTNEDSVKQAVEYLVELTKQEGSTMDAAGKKLVAQGMRAHMTVPQIQIAGCNIFNNLIVTANVDDVMYTSEVISVIPLAMKSHASSVELQQVAASLLMAFSADDGAAEIIGNQGGVQDVLAVMRTYPQNPELCATCCNTLWSLAVNENNAKIVTEEKGIQDVVQSMITHSKSADLVEAACAAILSLSMEDENLEAVNDMDCVGHMLQAIETHIKEAKVVKNACMALASLVEPDEESAFKVLTNTYEGEEVQGIPIILRAYEQHKDNAEVVENICMLFMELVEYDDICKELENEKVAPMLNDIRKKYTKNDDIMAPCESALAKLAGGTAKRPTSARNQKK